MELKVEQLISFAELVPVPFYIKNGDGNYLCANGSFLRMFGMERHDVRGRSDRELFTPETGRIMHSVTAGCRAPREIVEKGVVLSDGLLHQLQFIVSSLKQEGGMVGGSAVVVLDLTLQKEMEGQLLQRTVLMHEVLDNFPEAVVVFDDEGRGLLWNRHSLNILGLAVGFSGTLNVEDALNSMVDEDGVVWGLEGFKRGDVKGCLSMKMGSEDVVNLEASCSTIPGFGRNFYIARFREYMNKSSVSSWKKEPCRIGLLLQDITGTILYCNDFFAEVHGYVKADMRGRNISVCYTMEQYEGARELKRKVLAGSAEGIAEMGHRTRMGERFALLSQSEIIYGSDKKPRFIASVNVEASPYQGDCRYEPSICLLGVVQAGCRFFLMENEFGKDSTVFLAEVGRVLGCETGSVCRIHFPGEGSFSVVKRVSVGGSETEVVGEQLSGRLESEWMEHLRRGEILTGGRVVFGEKVEDSVNGPRSFVVVPVFCTEYLWGFIRFDALWKESQWNREKRLLTSVAGELFGEAIAQREVRGGRPDCFTTHEKDESNRNSGRLSDF